MGPIWTFVSIPVRLHLDAIVVCAAGTCVSQIGITDGSCSMASGCDAALTIYSLLCDEEKGIVYCGGQFGRVLFLVREHMPSTFLLLYPTSSTALARHNRLHICGALD